MQGNLKFNLNIEYAHLSVKHFVWTFGVCGVEMYDYFRELIFALETVCLKSF